MTYLAQSKLETDIGFQSRTRAALTEQSLIFKDSMAGDMKALAGALLRNEAGPTASFNRMLAAAPGFADTADGGEEEEFDSSLIADADILAAVQADYPTVAALYYDAEGNPLP
jgi:hypothetical protein